VNHPCVALPLTTIAAAATTVRRTTADCHGRTSLSRNMLRQRSGNDPVASRQAGLLQFFGAGRTFLIRFFHPLLELHQALTQ
jgi:hypothetical protein